MAGRWRRPVFDAGVLLEDEEGEGVHLLALKDVYGFEAEFVVYYEGGGAGDAEAV